MDRLSRAVYAFPSAKTVSPRVASATDGAAPNSPAKLFGLSTSPRQANKETIAPPTRNRNRYCSTAGSYCIVHVTQQIGVCYGRLTYDVICRVFVCRGTTVCLKYR